MGGNVFKDNTSFIKIENILTTLNFYFDELESLFPNKRIFNVNHFHLLGSVGKKPVSGDIDLGIDTSDILDDELSDNSIRQWNIDPIDVHNEFFILDKRARTSTKEQLRIKAFLKVLTKYINQHSTNIYCDESKVSPGNIFSLCPQIDIDGNKTGEYVQIDWMIGNIQWLEFSYYSDQYPEKSNVKGLHRTQLLLAAFQQANLSFNHTSGVKDKTTGEVVATNPDRALKLLADRLNIILSSIIVDNYYNLHSALKLNCRPDDYSGIIDTYFKILDSTRCDIPDDLQDEWKLRKDRLGLQGKFLPENSNLKGL